jgi:hypothetical protein
VGFGLQKVAGPVKICGGQPLSHWAGRASVHTKCSVPHARRGRQDRPDLAGAAARDPRWLSRYIAAPQQLLDEKDPVARRSSPHKEVRMPNLNHGRGSADVIAYITANGSSVVSKKPAKPRTVRRVGPADRQIAISAAMSSS